MKTKIVTPTFGMCLLAGVLAIVLWLADSSQVAAQHQTTGLYPAARVDRDFMLP